MTSGFLPVDAVLWSLAVALLVLALWLARVKEDRWDPAVFFAGALGAAFGKGKLPLSEGPVPPEGWEGDPKDLDPVYAPADRLAPGCTWEGIGAWDDPTREAVRKRIAGVRLVWVEPPPLAVPEVETSESELKIEALRALLPRPEDRLVLAAHARADALLRLLHAEPALRDRARAVLLFAPSLDAAWLAERFTHRGFDVELAHEVPYLTLRQGPAAADQRLPVPAPPPDERLSLAPIDLGVLPDGIEADPRVGRALAALLAALC